MMNHESPIQLVTFRDVYEYAKKRGFGESDFEQNGWQILPLGRAKEALGHPVFPSDANAFAIVFHYHSPDGSPFGYATLRIIRGAKDPRTFVGTTDGDGPKMLAPPRRPPRVYFSRRVAWGSLPIGTEIHIHESVLKAESAIKKGYVALGISGCWGWGSKIHRIPLLEDFGLLPWTARGLKPVVVFDSNTVRGYPEFQDLLDVAVKRFAGAFQIEHHVPVTRRKIPPGAGGNSWGYDDWAATDNGGRFEGEPELVDSDSSRAALEKINAGFAYDHGTNRIVTLGIPHQIISVRDFKDKIKPLRYEDADGELKPASEAWLVWDKRFETYGPVYRPGADSIWIDAIAHPHPNMWSGWGCDSKEGDVLPFLDLLENCLTKEERNEFLMWMAWPLQHPSEKKSSKVPVLVGPEGVGKSAIFRVLEKIHGPKNCAFINSSDLESSFNSYIANRTLVVVDDFTKIDRKTNAKLRNIATNETIRVNAKFTPEYDVENWAALGFTGNEYDALSMEEDSRRFFVMKMTPRVKWSLAEWGSFWKWASEAGPSALRFYLEHLDLSAFKSDAPALLTEGKKLVAEASANSLHSWLRELKDYTGARRVCTAKELDFLYVRFGGGSQDVTPGRTKAITDWLASHGYVLATEAKVKIDGLPSRVWSLDGSSDWSSLAIKEEMAKNPLILPSKLD
jgi:hypothetical protein